MLIGSQVYISGISFIHMRVSAEWKNVAWKIESRMQYVISGANSLPHYFCFSPQPAAANKAFTTEERNKKICLIDQYGI